MKVGKKILGTRSPRVEYLLLGTLYSGESVTSDLFLYHLNFLEILITLLVHGAVRANALQNVPAFPAISFFFSLGISVGSFFDSYNDRGLCDKSF